MHFDIFSLECFLAVAETGSFTKAAQKLCRTQSAVSQQIAKLENQLQKKLFARNKHLLLTTDGEVFHTYAQKIVQLNHEATDRFKQPELQGEVRFGLPEDFASVFLSDVLSEYVALHPRIFLNVSCDLTLNLLERFKQKELDLVLLKMNRPDDFPNGIKVWSEALEWVGDPRFFGISDYPLPLVISPKPCVYRARAIQALESRNIKWRPVFSSHSFASKVAAVRAGMGVTPMPHNMVPKDLAIIRAGKNVPDLADTHISLLKHTHDNAAINSFEDFVMEHLRL